MESFFTGMLNGFITSLFLYIMGTYVMAGNPTMKVLAMYSLLSICVPIIMLTYVMVLNSMSKLFEDIFPAIELCQHNIMGPFVINSHAIVIKPLPLHYCILRSITWWCCEAEALPHLLIILLHNRIFMVVSRQDHTLQPSAYVEVGSYPPAVSIYIYILNNMVVSNKSVWTFII